MLSRTTALECLRLFLIAAAGLAVFSTFESAPPIRMKFRLREMPDTHSNKKHARLRHGSANSKKTDPPIGFPFPWFHYREK